MQTRHSLRSRQCPICLQSIALGGQLDGCQHLFCVDCIHTWSKTENTCPLCKRRFREIEKKIMRKVYSPRITRLQGKQRVENKDQAETVLLSNLLENDMTLIPRIINGDELNFLYYLMALDEQLDNLR